MATPIGPLDLGIEGIKKRAGSLAFESPYDALGLREGASVEAARAAYVRLAKLWHPDRLPLELEPVQAEVTRIYVHVRDSFRAITAAGQEAQAAH
jgi:curved DNA-binding protein CbpA